MPSKPCLCVSVFMANFVAFRSTLYNIKKSQKLTPTVYNVPDHQLEELKCFPFREFIHIIVRLSDPKLFLSRSKKKALPLHSPPRRFVRFRELSGRRRLEDDYQARPQAWDARPQAPVLRRHRGNRAPCLLGFFPPSSSHSAEPRAAPLPPRGRTELLPPVLRPSLGAPVRLVDCSFCSFGAGGA
jgi:hypothetical protein